MSDTFTKTPDEQIAEILGRYSVTDLVEQTEDDLRKADEQFYKSDSVIQVVEQGNAGPMRWWKIVSGGKRYEVRRFRNFVFCSCPAFFFHKRACKHVSATTGVLCEYCGVSGAKVGKLCYDCDMNAARFRPTNIGESNDYITSN